MRLGYAIREPESVVPSAPAPDLTVTRGLVWLEDQCEDPEQDAQTATLVEGFHDALMAPWNMTMIAVSVPFVIGYGIVESVRTGGAADPDASMDRALQWIPFSFAGPDPRTRGPDSPQPVGLITSCGQ